MSLTANFYAGDDDKLWRTYVPITGTHLLHPDDGDLVRVWQDEATPATRNLAWILVAEDASRPTFREPGLMRLPSLDFDGTDDRWLLWDNVAGSAKALSALFANSSKTMITALRIQGAGSNAANIYDNTAVFCDANGNFGLHLKTMAGVHTLYGYNYDGTADVTAGVTVSLDTDYVVMIRHGTGTLTLSVLSGDGGETRVDESVASGNTSDVAAQCKMGANYTNAQHFNGCIGQTYCDNTDLGSDNTPLDDVIEAWLPPASSSPTEYARPSLKMSSWQMFSTHKV